MENTTYDVVVLTAHRPSRATVAAANAHDRQGRAVETNLRSHVLDDDPEQGQDGRARSGVRLFISTSAGIVYREW